MKEKHAKFSDMYTVGKKISREKLTKMIWSDV